MANEQDLLKALSALKQKESENKLAAFTPYPCQMPFANSTALTAALIAGNQVGKAQPMDSLVLTPDGWIEMGDVRVGSEVIGSDGRTTRVTGVFPQGELDVYEIETNDGAMVRCSLDHLWTVRLPQARFNKASSSYGEWSTVTTGELLRLTTGSAKQRAELPLVAPVEFRNTKLPVDPYLIGVLLGDGGLTSRSIKVTTADKEIVSYLHGQCEAWGVRLKEYGITFAMAFERSSGGHNKLMDALKELGMMGILSGDKSVPHQYLLGGAEDRLALLQGLMDTDGTCDKRGLSMFYSSSKKLADDVVELAHSLGLVVSRHSSTKSCTYKGVKRCCLCHVVYFKKPTMPLFRLQRKIDRQRIFERPTARVITAIRKSGVEKCQCISVAAGNGLYVTNDYVVTHNTTLVAYMVACHLTGLYPEWWEGIRLMGATEWWAAGVTAGRVRDTIQRKLFGDLGRMGTGMIPKHLINTETIIKKTGTPMALDRVDIKNVNGDWSNIQFFSYDQGIDKFMGTTLDGGAWCDEEPPADINTEIKTRVSARNALLLYSFTPVDGITPLYDSIETDPKIHKVYISQTEVPHFKEGALARLHEGMSDAELSARRDGRPKIGAGKIFNFEERDYSIEPFEIPPYWRRLGALDVGLTHPTGAVMAAIDDDSKTVYITNEYRVQNKTAIDHAAHLKHWGVKLMTDPSAFNRQIGSGISTASIYQDEGLDLKKANNDVEASISEIRKMIGSGRLYIFKTCSMLLQEMRTYRTKETSDGKSKIVKVCDDLIDPLRYVCMGIEEHAEVPKRFRKRPDVKKFRPADKKVGY